MTAAEHRKIRKIIAVLKVFRDAYAKEENTVIASEFSRTMAILTKVLEEEKIDETR